MEMVVTRTTRLMVLYGKDFRQLKVYLCKIYEKIFKQHQNQIFSDRNKEVF
jgi:hypothetical protein